MTQRSAKRLCSVDRSSIYGSHLRNIAAHQSWFYIEDANSVGDATGDTYVRSDGDTGFGTWKRLTGNSIIGGVLLINKLVDTQMANFVEKVSGSTTVNPHYSGRITGAILRNLAESWTESDALQYTGISSLDGIFLTSQTFSSGFMAQQLFSFNLIEHVKRKYGTIPGANTADKVAWLKTIISKLVGLWYGYGSGPQGKKATLRRWDSSTSQWQDMNRISGTCKT